MSTKAEPGPFDAFEKAEPDEPIFTLRAHDVLAAPLVHEWVARKRHLITHSDMPEEKRTAELIQCREAEEIAFAMADWHSGLAEAQAAPEPESPKPGYTGHQSDAAELEAKARWDAIKGASTRLHNSVAEITDAAALLQPYGWEPERAAALNAAGQVKAVAAAVEPKRIGYAVTDEDRARAEAKAGQP